MTEDVQVPRSDDIDEIHAVLRPLENVDEKLLKQPVIESLASELASDEQPQAVLRTPGDCMLVATDRRIINLYRSGLSSDAKVMSFPYEQIRSLQLGKFRLIGISIADKTEFVSISGGQDIEAFIECAKTCIDAEESPLSSRRIEEVQRLATVLRRVADRPVGKSTGPPSPPRVVSASDAGGAKKRMPRCAIWFAGISVALLLFVILAIIFSEEEQSDQSRGAARGINAPAVQGECPTFVEGVYFGAVSNAYLDIAAASAPLGVMMLQLDDDPFLILDDAWRAPVVVYLALLRVAAETLLDLNAPPSTREIDSLVKSAARELFRLTELVALAIDDLDADKLAEATALGTSSAEKMTRYADMVVRFCD